MNRRDLVLALADRADTDRRTADDLLSSLIDIITETVATGEPVAVSGFAKFARVDRAARMGRNPQTGEPIKIKASRKARITPLKAFKDSVMTGKRAGAKKVAAKKTTAKKTTARKGPAKKTTAKKTTARKAPAKRAVAIALRNRIRRPSSLAETNRAKVNRSAPPESSDGICARSASVQPMRARSVRQRCRFVWVENRRTPAREAMLSTTFDHVQMVTGEVRLRLDSERLAPSGATSRS